MNKTQQLAVTAVFTALVAVVTMFLVIPIPASGGYFNLGEGVIYIAALLFGPFVGCIAGGVGSMLADVFSGYLVWAPATLIVKGIEGFIVGFLFARLKRAGLGTGFTVNTSRSFLGVLVGGFVMAGITMSLGVAFIPNDLLLPIILASGIMIACIVAVAWSRIKLIRLLIPMIAGGAVMVLGYLLYGLYGYSFPVVNYGALSEVVWNVIQVIAGIVIALLGYQPLHKHAILTQSEAPAGES